MKVRKSRNKISKFLVLWSNLNFGDKVILVEKKTFVGSFFVRVERKDRVNPIGFVFVFVYLPTDLSLTNL
jgi:hypothetical protein